MEVPSERRGSGSLSLTVKQFGVGQNIWTNYPLPTVHGTESARTRCIFKRRLMPAPNRAF